MSSSALRRSPRSSANCDLRFSSLISCESGSHGAQVVEIDRRNDIVMARECWTRFGFGFPSGCKVREVANWERAAVPESLAR